MNAGLTEREAVRGAGRGQPERQGELFRYLDTEIARVVERWHQLRDRAVGGDR